MTHTVKLTPLQKWGLTVLSTILAAGAAGSFATAIQVRDLARSNKQRLDAIEADHVSLEKIRAVFRDEFDRGIGPIQEDIRELKRKVDDR